MNDRIASLRSMLAKDSSDPFLHYSLAMEYASAGQTDRAVASFQQCMALDADYLPAYVEAGKAFRTAGRLDQAREVFASALALADRSGEGHVSDFVRQQLEALGPAR